MFTLESLIASANSNLANIGGAWVPSRPLRCCFWHRLGDAWYVLTGKYDAVKWPHQ